MIKFKYQNNLISVERHFHTNGHDIDRHIKVTIIEKIEKDGDIQSITEYKSTKRLQTYVPFQFNMQLNYSAFK